MPKINKSQYAILSLLSKKGMSGYDIKQMAEKVSPFHWSESNAQIYPILKNLEKNEWVTSTLDHTSGDRQRRLYEITQKGLDYLKAWLEEPTKPAQYREELLLKLTAGEYVPVPVMSAQLEAHYTQLCQQQKELQAIVETIHRNHPNGLRKTYLLMTYDSTALILEAKRIWCEKSLQILQAEISDSGY